MATEPPAGWRVTKVTARRTKADWAHFIHDIAQRYPDAERITLVMDNLSTHRPGALYESFPPAHPSGICIYQKSQLYVGCTPDSD